MYQPYSLNLITSSSSPKSGCTEPPTTIYNFIESFLTPDDNNFSDCSTNFRTLERALYQTDNNRFALISAFYPARQSSSLFVNVKYNFSNPKNNQSICHNWLWTTGTFYLIQSPVVFLFTSLCSCTLNTKYALLN